MATPSAKKIEKFGTQATKAKVVYVFANGDKHHKGVKITLKPNKTFEQILHDFNTTVGVPTGAVRQIFTPEGKPIKKLEELEDQGRYVCAGAERFLKDSLSPAIFVKEGEAPAPEPAKAPAKAAAPKKPTVSAYSKGGISKFGTQTDKAKVIYVYRNSDKHHEGVKVTVHETKFKTFDQLKEHLTREVKVNTGAVMKLYTIEGKQVKDLASLEDETKYVATGPEKFSEFVGKTEPEKPAEEPAKKDEEKSDEEKATEAAKAESAPKKEIQKFGMQTEKAKVIYVFRNGDKHHKGVKITVHPTKYKSMDQLKDALNKEVGVPTGAVLKVYTATGSSVKDLKDIVDGEKYVCAGAEKFNKELLPTAINSSPEEAAPVKTLTPSNSKTNAAPKKPTVGAYKDGIKKFGMQTEKAKVIYVFRNGDKHHKGVKVTVHETKYKTFDQLKEALSKSVAVPTGPVRQVFTKEGKLVKALDDLEDEGRYVAAGAEKFNASLLPAAINIESKTAKTKAEKSPKEEGEESNGGESADTKDESKTESKETANENGTSESTAEQAAE